MSDVARPPRPRRWSGAPRIVLFRPVPGDSPVHRLWAGTKLVAVVVVGITLAQHLTWVSEGVVAAAVVATAALARVPLSARPRLGWWLWAVLLVGAVFNLLASQPPLVRVAGVTVSLGALDNFALLLSFGLTMLVASLLVGWTTPAGELAPAVAVLGAPLRRLRLPVDEWAVAVGLCVRSLPLLVDELQTLLAARRLRPRSRPEAGGRPRRRRLVAGGGRRRGEAVDLLATSMAVTMRRASEMAEAMTARGGAGTVAVGGRRPGWRDAVALVVVAALFCALPWALSAHGAAGHRALAAVVALR